MSWQSYELDRIAQKLVLDARARDPKSLTMPSKPVARIYPLSQSHNLRLCRRLEEGAAQSGWHLPLIG
jgi:antitoxin (DNA-binding transcriptional repressor) of toxin-antitoxin stability system